MDGLKGWKERRRRMEDGRKLLEKEGNGMIEGKGKGKGRQINSIY